MYSYFVFWHDENYHLRRINICTKYKLWNEDVPTLVQAVKRRCDELKIPFNMADNTELRWILDPAHNDPVIWSRDAPKGAAKLAGEYPGRHIYSPNWRKR